MARRKKPQPKGADLEPSRAVAALEDQLELLQVFKGRRARDVDHDEKEWQTFTQNLIARSFGEPSRNLSQFYRARNAGRHNVMGISEAQVQSNFDKRIREFEGVLRAAITELQLELPTTTEERDFIGDPEEFADALKRLHAGFGEYREFLRSMLLTKDRHIPSEVVAKRAELRTVFGEVVDGLFQLGIPMEWARLGRRDRIFESALTEFRSELGIKGAVEATGWAQHAVEIALGKLRARQRQPRPSTSMENRVASRVKVFISHGSEDESVAERLIDLIRAGLRLSSEDIRCTSVDGYRLPVGADTDDQLRREILDAPVFVALISKSSLRSAYVMFEMGARWGAGMYLAPLCVPGVGPDILPGPLRPLNALRADNTSQLHQLVENLANVLSVTKDNAAAYQAKIDALATFGRE